MASSHDYLHVPYLFRALFSDYGPPDDQIEPVIVFGFVRMFGLRYREQMDGLWGKRLVSSPEAFWWNVSNPISGQRRKHK